MPGAEPTITWHSDDAIAVGGVDYDLQHAPTTTPGRLRLYKSRELIESYAPIIAEFAGANLFELGVFGGGSTGFFAQVCRPKQLTAVELSTERITTLDDHLARLGLADQVTLHYGVDQSDRDRLAAIVDDDFDGEPLDLVIDDASHLYGPTRASFEVLFPRLRPGGLYVIEDWRSQDWFIAMFVGVIGRAPDGARHDIEVGLATSLSDPSSIERPIFEHWFASTVADPGATHHEAVRTWYDDLPVATDPTAATIRDRLQVVLAERADGSIPPAPPTMGTIAAELCMGMKSGHPAFAEVAMGPHWISARRGAGAIDGPLSLSTVAADPFAILAPHGSGFLEG